MAKALLDTDMLSEILRGKNETVRRRAETYLSQHGQLTISVLTILEIVKGFERLQRHADIDRFLLDVEAMDVLALTPETAILAGRMYGALERAGQLAAPRTAAGIRWISSITTRPRSDSRARIGAESRATSDGFSRSKNVVALPRATARASVVLPAWRGPRIETTGTWLQAARISAARAARRIMGP
jgi:predicted nucleic acid-binding protein